MMALTPRWWWSCALTLKLSSTASSVWAPKFGSDQHLRLAKGLSTANADSCCAPAHPSLHPPLWGSYLHPSELVVEAKMMSALCSDSGVWASPFPARCLPHDVPHHTGHLDPLLPLIAPFPSGCSALYCFQHHSNLSVCSLLGLGSQGSLESVGCVGLLPGQGPAILS